LLVLYLIGAALLSVSPAFGSGLPVSARLLSGDELLRIGGIHDVQNHFAEALTYYDQALDVFRAHKQRKKEAIALTKIASIYERQGRRPEAAVQIRSALTLFSKAPDSPVHGDALFLSARLSLWLGARDDAAALLEQAQERYRQSKNVQALGSVTLQAGLLTIADASSDDGFREIQQVLDDARARRDDEQTLAALVALGDGNWILDRTDAAYTKYEEALALLEQRPQAAIETRVRIRIAGLSRIIGREEQGIGSAKRAITLSQSLRDVSTEAAAWTLLGSLHEALGHGPESEEAFRRALAIYRQQKVFVHAVRPTLPPSATSPMGSRSPARP
jgi:tetratricopeptide (TPR) repeat protein